MKKLAVAGLLLLAGSANAVAQTGNPAQAPYALVTPNYSAADRVYGQNYSVPMQYPHSGVSRQTDAKAISNYEPQPQSTHLERQAENNRLMFLQQSL